MAAKNVILRKKISNVVYDLYPKSIADQIVVGINNETEESLATRLVSLASDIASKVPEQLSQNQTFTQWKASVDAALQSDNINFDTLQEIVDWVEGHEDLYQTLITAFNTTKTLAEANEDAIEVLNGDVNTTGSVDKKINDAVSPVSTKANANEAAITVLNGSDTTAGSVAKAIKDAVEDMQTNVDNKGAVYASTTQPAEFGEYDLWVYLQN